jgi:DNA repair exonuclease SbcCD ATPase subunit
MSDNDLVFREITISGFLSYPPHRQQTIDLNTNRLTAIIGTNLDGGPGERNGAGKTAIVDALQYLYFGRTTRLPNKGFLNYVEPGPLLVSGSASRDGIDFYVERGENPSVLRLFEKASIDKRDWFEKNENGRYLFETTKSSKPETTKRIVELLGFDLKLTEVLLVNNPSDKSCYFLKEEKDQREIQERIFGFTVFTEKAERLRELRREESKTLATKEAAFIATRQANDRVLAEITQLEEKAKKWAADRDQLAKFLTQQIRSYQNIDFDVQQQHLARRAAINSQISQIERDLALYERGLDDAEMRFKTWNHTHQDEVTSLRQTLVMLSQADANQDIETIKTRDTLRQSLAQIDSKTAALEAEMTSKRKLLHQQTAMTKTLAARIDAVEQKIVALDASKCPTCGQDWADTQQHLQHCVDELTALTGEHEALEAQMRETKTELAGLQDDANQALSARQEINTNLLKLPKTQFRTIEEASAAFARTEELVKKLAEIENATNPHEDALQQQKTRLAEQVEKLEDRKAALIEEQGFVTRFDSLPELEDAWRNLETVKAQFQDLQNSENPYRETIDNLREHALKEVDETEVRELKTRIEHMSLLITLLSDKDSPIRRAVLNEWLPELNMRVNRYLELLELPHRVAFDGDMTATFTDMGKSLVFENLSAGQRLRAWLATCWAFREIFELVNYRINLFFVDEVLDKGMSDRGAEVAYNLLNKMVHEDKSVFLITHRQPLVDIADHVLSVNFENKLSQIAA